ncbi:uncharacterized protein LOC124942455 [Impatiens glandulifera]|uniref:uncharacterized protein LOC124942455 n=1 Tax=Impatiens glandulifera TaxID=253017 RepID=UPI001FB0A9C7|nr:uncharacterized protein LOC124942455 [Impatiens glandulifera]
MNHNHPPSPSPSPSADLDLRTAFQVIKQAGSIYLSHIFTFLLLSFLILTFRCNVENGTHLLTGFIDRDPSFRSLLSRLDISGRNVYSSDEGHTLNNQHQHRHHRRRHRRPFLHLTRVGTIDDDFFSGDEENDRFLFGSHSKVQMNDSFIIFSSLDSRLGFSTHVTDNGIKFPETVRRGLSFKLIEESLLSKELDLENETVDSTIKTEKKRDGEKMDLQFLFKGLDLSRSDVSALIFLVFLLSMAYAYVIIGFLVTYSWVLGTVFSIVVNHLIGRYRSWTGILWDGSTLGLKRLSGFILMRWALRDALTQLLGIWFFGEIEDQYSFFKICVRLKLMPFSINSPWVRGFEKETSGFLFSWVLSDIIVEFILAVDCWVAIVDSRKSGREIVKEGLYLLCTMFKQAFTIKCLESLLCGSFTKFAMTRYVGKLFATGFQSVMEVYFMVAWLILYLSMRKKDAIFLGKTFGQRELEGIIHGLR